jgi:hypothetical protein
MTFIKGKTMENLLPLTIEETYFYYDGPKLFCATDEMGSQYMVVCVDEDVDAEIFLAARLDSADIKRLEQNQTPLRDAYDGTMTQDLFVLRWGKEGSLKPIDPATISNDWLPEADVLLRWDETCVDDSKAT